MSILSLSILTADRLIAVLHALRYCSIMTEFRANLLVCLQWFTVAIIFIIQGGIYLGISMEMELRIRTYELATFYVLGTTVLCIGNATLYFVFRTKRQSVLTSAHDNSTTDTKDTKKLHRNLARIFSDSKICIWMTTIFLVCWTPGVILYVAFDPNQPTIFSTTCMFLSISNSLLNPVIYFIKREDFRKLFKELFVHCKTMIPAVHSR